LRRNENGDEHHFSPSYPSKHIRFFLLIYSSETTSLGFCMILARKAKSGFRVKFLMILKNFFPAGGHLLTRGSNASLWKGACYMTLCFEI